jgi:hypothetical protein
MSEPIIETGKIPMKRQNSVTKARLEPSIRKISGGIISELGRKPIDRKAFDLSKDSVKIPSYGMLGHQ